MKLKFTKKELNKLITECMCQMNLENVTEDDVEDLSNTVLIKMIDSDHQYDDDEDDDYEDDDYEDKKMRSNGRMLDYGKVKSDSEEAKMTKQNLFYLSRYSKELHNVLHDNDDLPEWVQEKVATSLDRLQSVYKYIMHKIEMEND